MHHTYKRQMNKCQALLNQKSKCHKGYTTLCRDALQMSNCRDSLHHFHVGGIVHARMRRSSGLVQQLLEPILRFRSQGRLSRGASPPKNWVSSDVRRCRSLRRISTHASCDQVNQCWRKRREVYHRKVVLSKCMPRRWDTEISAWSHSSK